MKLRKINLYFGFMLFIVFLITGFYMAKYFKPEHIDNHVMRMQIRANHIYILFISLLNVLSFKCNLKLEHRFSNYLNVLFRTLLIVSGIIAVIAFLNEHTGDLKVRSWTLYTVILSLFSVGLVIVNEVISVFLKKES